MWLNSNTPLSFSLSMFSLLNESTKKNTPDRRQNLQIAFTYLWQWTSGNKLEREQKKKHSPAWSLTVMNAFMEALSFPFSVTATSLLWQIFCNIVFECDEAERSKCSETKWWASGLEFWFAVPRKEQMTVSILFFCIVINPYDLSQRNVMRLVFPLCTTVHLTPKGKRSSCLVMWYETKNSKNWASLINTECKKY